MITAKEAAIIGVKEFGDAILPEVVYDMGLAYGVPYAGEEKYGGCAIVVVSKSTGEVIKHISSSPIDFFPFMDEKYLELPVK